MTEKGYCSDLSVFLLSISIYMDWFWWSKGSWWRTSQDQNFAPTPGTLQPLTENSGGTVGLWYHLVFDTSIESDSFRIYDEIMKSFHPLICPNFILFLENSTATQIRWPLRCFYTLQTKPYSSIGQGSTLSVGFFSPPLLAVNHHCVSQVESRCYFAPTRRFWHFGAI